MRTRLPFSPLLLAGTFALATGCVLTIDDDFDSDSDDVGDTETDEGDTSSTSESTSDGDTSTDSTGDGDTTDTSTDSSTDSTTDSTGDGDTTDSTGDGDTTDSTDTGDGDCDPMDAMQGPEDCFNPRGWFWNGESCEQIICTCDGSDCNALFPDESACVDQYGECQPPPPPDCEAQMAEGIGFCQLFLGWKWDGLECVPVSGCECEGPDCGNLYAESDLCKDDHGECGFGGECEPDDAMPIGDCDLFLGVVWTGDNCVGISGCECEGADCDNLPLDSEVCWDEHALCELGDPCEADDALGVGPCDAFFGYAWNGSECVGQSGCECVGPDCMSLPFEPGICEELHDGCGAEPCAGVMDAQGVGMCQLFLGYAWNGMACVGISGCSCEGVDCGNLYPELDVCEGENAGCL